MLALMRGDLAMDGVSFDTWLDAIRLLTARQRQEGFMYLALAEGDDEAASVLFDASPVSVDGVSAVVDGKPLGARIMVESDEPPMPVSAAAQSRVESAGCPHCASRRLHRWGHASDLPRYRCRDCRRTFNGLTATPLAHLRKKDRWEAQAEALITGESVAKAAKRCGVSGSTAFRWRHRFLAAAALDKPIQLSGIVEADETFILESFKGKRSDLPRAARKRGGKAAKRGLSGEQIPILVARDRSGATTDAVLPKLNRASVTTALGGVVTAANQLCCDGGKAIVGFARKVGMACQILPPPGGPRPEAPNLHINNVNGYHSRLKEWLRPFHGVATKYLDHYLGWRRTVEALGDGAQPANWLLSAVGIGQYQ
ncbi:MAG: IS1595 family transposase [Rhodopila sp.]